MSLPALSEAELLARVRSGDGQAFSDLYDRHGALVFGYALRLTADRALAEDVSQEVFLALLRHGGTYDPARPFIPWLLTLVRNKAIDFFRRTGNKPEALAPAHLEDLPSKPADSPIGEPIERALAELPAAFREAVWLSDGLGIPYVEVAEILGCDVGTVGSRVSRGRKLLRDYFSRHADVL